MLEHSHHAGLLRLSSTVLSTRGQGNSSAGHHQYCCSQYVKGSLTEHAIPFSGLEKTRTSATSGFMIKTSIARKLQNLPIAHSDRLMFLRVPVQDNKFATVITVYASTLQADTAVTCITSCSKLTPMTIHFSS